MSSSFETQHLSFTCTWGGTVQKPMSDIQMKREDLSVVAKDIRKCGERCRDESNRRRTDRA